MRMSPVRWKLLGATFVVSLVLLVVWVTHSNQVQHHRYGKQITARVLNVSALKKINISLTKDEHYRLATIEVTTRTGKVWDYYDQPVEPEVSAGMGLHAWVSNQATGDDLFYEKAAATKQDDEVYQSPYNTWWGNAFYPVIAAIFITGAIFFFTVPFYLRGGGGGGPGLDDQDDPEPEDDGPEGPEAIEPYDREREQELQLA